MIAERENIIALIDEARSAGARQSAACEIIGFSAKTLQRWTQPENSGDGRLDTQREPANKLTELERRRILKVANEPEYAHLSPAQMVPTLADEGRYIGSESTVYRTLKAEKQLAHRQKAKPVSAVKKPTPLIATAPNEIFSWDITYRVPGAQHKQGCLNEPRVYLKYINKAARAKLFMSVSGCAGI